MATGEEAATGISPGLNSVQIVMPGPVAHSLLALLTNYREIPGSCLFRHFAVDEAASDEG